MRRGSLMAAALVAALAGSLTACGGDSEADSNTIRVAYQRSTDNNARVMDNYLEDVKKTFEAANSGKTVELVPIQASENDYYTKLQLMMRSSNPPDLVYEDTFLINSDIEAGYLAPLDDYLAKWEDWSQYEDTAKSAAKALDGKTYGIPDGTDTRGLWYNKEIFAQAGLPVPWEPKTWDDVLAAARTVKQKLPGVIPWNIYSGKAGGEASAMQGFEMLLYGTEDRLYNPDEEKWVVGSQGFKDALGMIKTVFVDEQLGPKVEQSLDPNVGSLVGTDWFPNNKLAIDLDGSWIANGWLETGANPWPEWNDVMGQTAMPTQEGQGKGKISLSGGWTWAMTSKSQNKDLAWDFITHMQTADNAAKYDIAAVNIAVRKDVAEDPAYLESNPTTQFFTDLVEVTEYRPALPEYPKISNEITVAMESVMTGQQTVDEAAAAYDDAVKGIVGEDKTTTKSP